MQATARFKLRRPVFATLQPQLHSAHIRSDFWGWSNPHPQCTQERHAQFVSRSPSCVFSSRRRASCIRFAVCLVGLIAAGCGENHASTPAVTAPTAIPRRAITPTTLTGAGLTAVIAAQDRKELLRSSYTPDRYEVGYVAGGTPILVFHSVCTGSADGHCQAIQVFRGRNRSPVWVGHFAGVKSFHTIPGGFTITSVHYAASDPLCCPSLPPVTHSYRWTGKGFQSLAGNARTTP